MSAYLDIVVPSYVLGVLRWHLLLSGLSEELHGKWEPREKIQRHQYTEFDLAEE
jgi:hypothetical protein